MKRKLYLSQGNNIRSLFIILFVSFGCSNKKESISYYENHKVKCKCELLNNKKNGLEVCYFKDGKVKSTQNWEKGIQNGIFKEYYKNSNIYNISNFNDNLLNGKSTFWDTNGRLIETHYYINDTLVDFVKKDNIDTNKLDEGFRMPLFFNKNDTIKLGTFYKTKIRLANRKYNQIKVMILKIDTITDEFLINSFSKSEFYLPNVDSITSFYEVKPNKKGNYHFEGIIYEIDSLKEEGNIKIFPKPFQKDIFVK